MERALRRVVALAGLDDEHLVAVGEVDSAVGGGVIGALGRVADAVLVAQLLFDISYETSHSLSVGRRTRTVQYAQLGAAAA